MKLTCQYARSDQKQQTLSHGWWLWICMCLALIILIFVAVELER